MNTQGLVPKGTEVEGDSMEVDENEPSHDALSPFDRELERIGDGWFHYKTIALLGLGNASDAVELLAISYILPQIPSVSSTEKGALSAAMFAGMFLGGMFTGVLGDRLGRKPCLLISLFINASFGMASALAPNWILLAMCRVMSGLGVGGSVPSLWTIATEILPIRRRGLYLTIVAWWWMLGGIYAAGLAWVMMGVFELSWRWFAVVAALPSLICGIISFLILEESPRFYLIKKRYPDVLRVLRHMSKLNGKGPCRLTENDFGASHNLNGEPTSKRLRLYDDHVIVDYDLLTSTPPKHNHTISHAFGPFFNLFHPSVLRTTVFLIIIWWALNFGWYGLTLWLPTLFDKVGFSVDVYQDTFLVSASNLPGNIIVTLLIEWTGRRNLLGGTLFISTALVVVLAFFQDSKATVVALSCTFSAISCGCWNTLDCLSTESFATTQRSTAMGVLTATGRLAALTAQFVNGALIDWSVFALLIVTSGNLVVGAVAAFLLPHETGHRKLDDDIHRDAKPLFRD